MLCFGRAFFCYLLDELKCNELPVGHELPAALMGQGNSIHEIADFKS